ncbi:hypothetical protein DPEC_G00263850 [Dallia pectoralis]|uniref:Uncharacterized protein n=1 Tax=Dallia pectoralis TaxID=75939 RepID=A0ACC2FSB2_DALPE|nr:hypothetical protein DPEC_G00263850 [Dallia pectoralis]
MHADHRIPHKHTAFFVLCDLVPPFTVKWAGAAGDTDELRGHKAAPRLETARIKPGRGFRLANDKREKLSRGMTVNDSGLRFCRGKVHRLSSECLLWLSPQLINSSFFLLSSHVQKHLQQKTNMTVLFMALKPSVF